MATGRGPYTGRVLGVADDTTGTYALYSNQNGIWVGRRTTAGTFTKPVRVSTRGNGGAVLPQGDIVAQGGGYWAVWTEQVGPGGEFAQQEVFQAKTLEAGSCTSAISRHGSRRTTAMTPTRPWCSCRRPPGAPERIWPGTAATARRARPAG